MLYDGKIWVGTGEKPVLLLPQMANRHGLIAGATGTGKTVSLKVLAEGFSDLGVPVFLADVKGDLSGMVKPGEHSEGMAQRCYQLPVSGLSHRFLGCIRRKGTSCSRNRQRDGPCFAGTDAGPQRYPDRCPECPLPGSG